MAARLDSTLDRYFEQLESAFVDLARLADERTVLVQMVGFHDQEEHLSRYLVTMERAGFTEFVAPELGEGSVDGRLWRGVPNRRWWVQDGTRGVHTAQEVVLVHKKSR